MTEIKTLQFKGLRTWVNWPEPSLCPLSNRSYTAHSFYFFDRIELQVPFVVEDCAHCMATRTGALK